MANTAFWMFKWRVTGGKQRWHGDFSNVLPKGRGFRAQGFQSPLSSSMWKTIHKGDIVFCYQSEQRDVVGAAKVVKTGTRQDGLLYVDLKPLRHFRRPVDIQACKATDPIIRKASWLQPRSNQTIYRMTMPEARHLAEVCRIKSLVGRCWQRTAKTGVREPSKRPAPQSPPVPPIGKYVGDETVWANRLLDRHLMDPQNALVEADLEVQKLAAGSPERQLWEAVRDHIYKECIKCGVVHSQPVPFGSEATTIVAKELEGKVADPIMLITLPPPTPPTPKLVSTHEQKGAGEWTLCPVCKCSLQTKNLAVHRNNRCPLRRRLLPIPRPVIHIDTAFLKSRRKIANKVRTQEVAGEWTFCPECKCEVNTKRLIRHLRRTHGPQAVIKHRPKPQSFELQRWDGRSRLD